MEFAFLKSEMEKSFPFTYLTLCLPTACIRKSDFKMLIVRLAIGKIVFQRIFLQLVWVGVRCWASGCSSVPLFMPLMKRFYLSHTSFFKQKSAFSEHCTMRSLLPFFPIPCVFWHCTNLYSRIMKSLFAYICL